MKNLIKYLWALPLLLVSCEENEMGALPTEESSLKLTEQKFEIIDVDIKNNLFSKNSNNKEGNFENFVDELNQALVEYDVQLSKMEFLAADGEVGRTVDFKIVGKQQQQNSEWVPNDPRNYVVGPNLLYWTDGTELGTTSGMSDADTYSSINSAMNTWANVSCSKGLGLINGGRSDEPLEGIVYGNVGFVQSFFNRNPSQRWLVPGTILHAGILPIGFFNMISRGNGDDIIAVTFTWIWGSPNGPTDIDNNGKRDSFAKEIYYNDDKPFQDEPEDVMFNNIVDFETVVLHEVGHALGQSHYGQAFVTGANDKVHFAPFALMNPNYSIAQREITGTDEAKHCNIWVNWPEE